MFGLQVLDVAIGLSFIFLLLSLVVTSANEVLAAWLKRRSATLWRGMVMMLGGDTAGSLYQHPLIRSLTGPSMLLGRFRHRLPFKVQPSYIPSRTFALALLDHLAPAQAGRHPEALAGDLQKALAGKNDPLSRSLSVLLEDAGGNVEQFKQRLEQWFDTSMERVSGWYKRRTQWILLLLAALVTMFTNADAVAIANTLWHDPAVRSALVAQAQQYAQEQREQDRAAASQAASQQAQAAKQAKAAAQEELAGPEPPDRLPYDPAEEEFQAAEARFQSSLERLQNLAIPLGWKDPGQPADPREPFPESRDEYRAALYRHWLGWLLSALAISLGAPFWFDMLNKVISIRAAGKAPQEKKPPDSPASGG
jgi:hypothetical protein